MGGLACQTTWQRPTKNEHLISLAKKSISCHSAQQESFRLTFTPGAPPSLEQSNEHADNGTYNNFSIYANLKAAKDIRDEVPYDSDEDENAEEDIGPSTSRQ